jgi:hypothetical protein
MSVSNVGVITVLQVYKLLWTERQRDGVHIAYALHCWACIADPIC